MENMKMNNLNNIMTKAAKIENATTDEFFEKVKDLMQHDYENEAINLNVLKWYILANDNDLAAYLDEPAIVPISDLIDPESSKQDIYLFNIKNKLGIILN